MDYGAGPQRRSTRTASVAPARASEETPATPDPAQGKYVAIRDLPPSERPRERLAALGPEALSLAELVAILWRTGTSGTHPESALALATRALATHDGLAGLASASLADLVRMRGVGPVKAIELKAAFELARRLSLATPDARRVIRTPRDIVDMLGPEVVRLDREHLHVVLLSTKHHVIGIREIYRGTLNSSVVRVAELFKAAIRDDAASIIIVHNHPSGDPTPSGDDIQITTDAVAAGRLLDIEVIDHVIVGSRTLQWASLRERRLGFGDAPA